MTTLLQTKEDQDIAVANLTSMQTHQGWLLLVQIVEENINILTQQLIDGVPGETKEDIDRKRDKIRVYKDIIYTPELLITRLNSKDTFKDGLDPYETIEDVRKRKQS